MNQNDRLKLQANYKKLSEVSYSAISPHLISTFILDLEMHAEIEWLATDKRRMERLIQLLPSRGDRAMKELMNALRPSYSWLAIQLQEEVPAVAPDYDVIRNNIRNNNNAVPAAPVNLTPTPNITAGEIKEISIQKHVRPIEQIFGKSVMLSWTMLANSMEISPFVITDIRRNMANEGGTMYAVNTVLQAWISKLGPSKATFGQLIKIAESLELNEVTEGLIDLWTTLQQ